MIHCVRTLLFAQWRFSQLNVTTGYRFRMNFQPKIDNDIDFFLTNQWGKPANCSPRSQLLRYRPRFILGGWGSNGMIVHLSLITLHVLSLFILWCICHFIGPFKARGLWCHWSLSTLTRYTGTCYKWHKHFGLRNLQKWNAERGNSPEYGMLFYIQKNLCWKTIPLAIKMWSFGNRIDYIESSARKMWPFNTGCLSWHWLVSQVTFHCSTHSVR